MSDDPKPSEIPTDREGRPFYADRVVVTRGPRAMLDGVELPSQGFDGVTSEWMQEQVDDMGSAFVDAWASEHTSARSIDMQGEPLTFEGIRRSLAQFHLVQAPTSFQTVVNENGSIQHIVISPDPVVESIREFVEEARRADQGLLAAVFGHNPTAITALEFAERSGSLAADEVLREEMRPRAARRLTRSLEQMSELIEQRLESMVSYTTTTATTPSVHKSQPSAGFSVSGYLHEEPETYPDPIDIGPGGLVAHVDPHAAVREVRAYAHRHQGSSVLLVINGSKPSAVVRQLLDRPMGWSAIKIGRSVVHVRQFWDGSLLQLRGDVHRVHWLFDPDICRTAHERSLAEEARAWMAAGRAKHARKHP